MPVAIYHNPRCSKSREGLCEIENFGADFEVIDYTRMPFTVETLTRVVGQLGIKPAELVRTGEDIYKSRYAHRKIYGKEWINIMVKHPELIQRPIIVKNGKAIIGRPKEAIEKFLAED